MRLICFYDASTRAYAAVIYLQAKNGDCSVVASKTRVAPLQTEAILRLELLDAVLLARPIEKCYGQFKSLKLVPVNNVNPLYKIGLLKLERWLLVSIGDIVMALVTKQIYLPEVNLEGVKQIKVMV
uniref:Uncharacterized protein n=1 Tax=Amphimedon queenslandica TaxID=400682 RepID=A0A1X7VFJ5_AMPQE